VLLSHLICTLDGHGSSCVVHLEGGVPLSLSRTLKLRNGGRDISLLALDDVDWRKAASHPLIPSLLSGGRAADLVRDEDLFCETGCLWLFTTVPYT